MGFDNECILNIQSLAGEYFCPVCRTLVYPHEALQTQCTHLYCKPCLTYVVGSTQACPYDGYLVTEAGSKPLMESNKALAETIGKTAVHCLYHRSGCVWKGLLSECTAHCTGCDYGNSPVVCNRCGIQIVHRQVQEHAQTCNVNGTNTNTQTQGSETAQDAASSGAAVSVDQSKIANQAAPPASQPQTSHTATGPPAAQNLNQAAPTNSLPQAMPPAAALTPEQWYQQQYYQQYPGYDPYQQGYQQYYPYQQQPAQQFQQPPSQAQNQPPAQPLSQPQIQTPIQPQPQIQPLPQAQGQPQLQMHSQTQPQMTSNGQSQSFYPQAAVVGSSQNQVQVNPQQQALPGGQLHVQIQSQNQPLAHRPPQSYSQVQPPLVQSHAQPQMQVPQYQQPHPQMHHSQPPPVHPHPQPQSQPQPHPQVHPPFQPHPQPPPQSQPINPQHPPVQPVAGHPTYPTLPHQQVQHVPPQQHPMQVHPPVGSLPPAQFPQPPPHMRPPTQPPPHMLPLQGQAPGIPPTQQHIRPHSQPGLPPHQRPVQQPMPQQYMQQPQAFPGQAPGQLQGQPHQAGSFAHPYPQVRPQGPPQPMQQSPLGFVQPQQGTALPHGMPPHSSQSYMGRPPLVNQGGQSQQFPQSSGVGGIAPQARPPQFGPSQPSVNMTNQPHEQQNQYAPPLGGGTVDRKGDQTFERRVEQQEDKSPSLKKPESAANDYGASFHEVKPETGMNDERKSGNGVEDGHRKDEALTKNAASELHQVQGVPGDSVTTQRVKEESKGSALEHSPGGKLSHSITEDGGVAPIDSVKQGEGSASFQGSSEADKGSLAGHDARTFSQSQTTPQVQTDDVSGGFPSKGTEQGRSPLPPAPYAFSGQQQRPAAPPLLPSAPNSGQTLGHPPSHLRPPGHGYLPHGPHPGQASNMGEPFQPPVPFHPEFPSAGGPNSFPNSSRGYEPQYNQGPLHGRHPRMSQGESLGPPLPHGPDGQTVPRHPGPMDMDMYQNKRPPHFDSRPDSHLPYGQPFGAESGSMRMNGAPPPGLDSLSAPPFRDEKFRTPAGMHPDAYPMGPGEFKGSLRQYPGPPHDSLKFGSHSSRPLSGYGMDGPSRFLDKDPHGYGFDGPGSGGGFLPPYHSSGGLHPHDSGGRPFPGSMHDDNRGRFENNRHNPDFLGPMHGFGRHHMDRSPGHPSRPFDDHRDMERHSFGERFPMGPPGHMHRGEFDFPGKPRRNLSGREPGFGSFHDYGPPRDTNGPGGFSHQPSFGDSFGSKSGHRPHLGEPGFRSSYSRHGFPGDGGYFSGGPDSFDLSRKRNNLSMGWCRICKIDCESVEGLDMHGQTREHQRMAMDMVISIKQKNAKKQKTSSDHSSREESKHARVNVS